MNTKIKKVIREIDIVEEKLTELGEKLKQLKAEKVELENLEIIAMFRGYKVSTYDIEQVMENFRKYHTGSGNEAESFQSMLSEAEMNKEDIVNEEN